MFSQRKDTLKICQICQSVFKYLKYHILSKAKSDLKVLSQMLPQLIHSQRVLYKVSIKVTRKN